MLKLHILAVSGECGWLAGLIGPNIAILPNGCAFERGTGTISDCFMELAGDAFMLLRKVDIGFHLVLTGTSSTPFIRQDNIFTLTATRRGSTQSAQFYAEEVSDAPQNTAAASRYPASILRM